MHLDASVGQVARPPTKTASLGAADHEPAESNSLHATLHDESPRNHASRLDYFPTSCSTKVLMVFEKAASLASNLRAIVNIPVALLCVERITSALVETGAAVVGIENDKRVFEPASIGSSVSTSIPPSLILSE